MIYKKTYQWRSSFKLTVSRKKELNLSHNFLWLIYSHRIKSLSSLKHASTVGGASRAGTVSSLLPGTYRTLACENVSSDRWYDGEKGDQKASKSDHPRGQKRPTMGLKAWLRAWLRWRTPFYHRARRSGPPFSTTNQTSRAFSSRGPSPHLSAAAWCWHNQSVECQPATVKWTTVKQGDRQTVVAE